MKLLHIASKILEIFTFFQYALISYIICIEIILKGCAVVDANRLKRARAAKGLTQKQMADLLEIDKTTYYKYEAGLSNPNMARLEKLAEILEITPNYLMGQEEEPIPLKHQDIFELYLKLTDKQKEAIDTMIKTMAGKE